MKELGWGIWAIRFGITMVSTAGIAWFVSFAVADYVVRANTSSSVETMRALQSSIDRLNESVIANSGRLDAFTSNMTILMERSATTATEIAAIRTDLARVQTSVQAAGIDIKIGGEPLGKQFSFEEFKAIFGLDATDPIFLEIPAAASE